MLEATNRIRPIGGVARPIVRLMHITTANAADRSPAISSTVPGSAEDQDGRAGIEEHADNEQQHVDQDRSAVDPWRSRNSSEERAVGTWDRLAIAAKAVAVPTDQQDRARRDRRGQEDCREIAKLQRAQGRTG